MGTQPGLLQTDLDLPVVRGKVRDAYELAPDPTGGGRLALVATDRLSAFDVVLPTAIPGKGELLTQIAAFWLRWIESRGLARTHLLSTDEGEIPDRAFVGVTRREDLRGRVTICRRCRVLPVECVVRGYLEGSGWRDYQRTGVVCGHVLPAGLVQCDRLPEPIFTPATKAERGSHDENIDEARAAGIIGADRLAEARSMALSIYREAAAFALGRGIIIADTKFEFGVDPADPSGPLLVVDEALTPDSSRFWRVDSYRPGGPQASFDKQFVREYLESLVERGQWDKTPPGPELPGGVVEGTLSRYREARDRLLG